MFFAISAIAPDLVRLNLASCRELVKEVFSNGEVGHCLFAGKDIVHLRLRSR